MGASRQVQGGARAPPGFSVTIFFHETSIYSSLKIVLTIVLQLNRDDAKLFSTEGLEEHQFFSFICMHCNKKVGAMSHRLHPLQKKSCGSPFMSNDRQQPSFSSHCSLEMNDFLHHHCNVFCSRFKMQLFKCYFLLLHNFHSSFVVSMRSHTVIVGHINHFCYFLIYL